MATMKQVSNDIISDLKKFDKLPRFIGASLHSETFERIFTKGIKTDGTEAGNYTPYTISLKKESNHFTSTKVNFRNTDQLANSYIFEPKKDEVLIGFESISRNDGTTNDAIVKKLEKQYGEIFTINSDEQKLVDELLVDFTDKLFE